MTAESQRIRSWLQGNTRDLLLFELALETAVPMQQLLALKVGELEGLQPGDRLPLAGEEVPLSEAIFQAFTAWRSEWQGRAEEPIFHSRRSTKPLSLQSVSRIVKGWLQATGCEGVGGLHELRQYARRRQQERRRQRPAAAPPEVESASVQEHVYSELEEGILAGTIAPGKHLVEDELAREMGVSRIPVREALGRLEAKGFVTARSGRGRMVATLSAEELLEIQELRLLLEPEAAVKACAKRDDAFLLDLRRAMEAYSEARQNNDVARIMEKNRTFHFLIYRQAESPVLLELITTLYDRSSPYFHLLFAELFDARRHAGVKSHEKIMEMFTGGDVDGVRYWVGEDIRVPGGVILAHFKAESS